MRMRLKKHLDERIANCQSILLAREGKDFYKLSEQERICLIDLEKEFGNNNKICLELGCGKGTYAITAAQINSDTNYIAVEKLSNVVVVACENAISANVTNLRFLNCRAENLLCFLPKNSVSRIVLNFSCPFPKKTYANRRLTSNSYLEIYKKLLVPDGILLQKTDDDHFFEYSIESLENNGFEVFYINRDLPANAEDNIVTEYEAKFREQGKKINALKARLKTVNTTSKIIS